MSSTQVVVFVYIVVCTGSFWPQHLLLRVLFEPLVYFDASPYVEQGAVIVDVVPIPRKKRGLLGTPYGVHACTHHSSLITL